MLGTVYTDIEQGTQGWHDIKNGLASSSNFGDIMAKGRYGKEAAGRRNYRARLVLEKLTGKTPERFKIAETDAMRWGNDTEELARLEYELRTGRLMQKITGIKHPFLDVWSSTDGVDDPTDIKRVLELKCFNSANHYEALMTGKLPAEYKPEVMGELWLAEADICDFVSFDPDFPENAQLVIITVERDQEYIDDLTVEVARFMDEVDKAVAYTQNYKLTI